MHRARPANGLLQRRFDLRVEFGNSAGDHVRRHAEGRWTHPVESLPGREDGFSPPLADIVDNRHHALGRVGDIDLRTRHDGLGIHIRAAKIDAPNHAGEFTLAR